MMRVISCCFVLFVFFGGTSPVEGKTLSEYIAEGDYQSLKQSIKSGAHLNEPDTATGYPPLLMACQTFSIGYITAFIEGGADINAQDNEGNTCLHHASMFGNLEIIDYLIGHGASITIRNKEGKTPAQVEPMGSDDQEEIRLLLTGQRKEANTLFERKHSARKKFNKEAIKKIEQISNRISWNVSADDLISDFKKDVEVVWVGKVVALHDRTDVFTKEPFYYFVCLQYPLKHASVEGVREPIQVIPKPKGAFLVMVGGESVPFGGDEESIYNMDSPVWVVVKGRSKLISNYQGLQYVGLEGDYATVSDTINVRE